MRTILRNDDVCAATTVEHLRRFCALTDRYGYQVLHAITPRGVCWASDNWLGAYKNHEILSMGAGKTIEANGELVEFLRSRASKDLFALHGLFHTHRPPVEDWLRSRDILMKIGLYPLYVVPPFNEGHFKSHDFIVSAGDAANFETEQMFPTPIAALHSWRYDPEMWRGAYKEWWTWESLEERLQYPVMGLSVSNEEKYSFLAPRITGRWLDIGCNTGMLLDMVPNGIGVDSSSVPLRAGMIQAKAEELPFPDNAFDTAVLCGVLEQCRNWREVLREALRVAGRVIGTVPYPGTRYGTPGYTQWTVSVIPESEFTHTGHTERINEEHFFFEVTK